MYHSVGGLLLSSERLERSLFAKMFFFFSIFRLFVLWNNYLAFSTKLSSDVSFLGGIYNLLKYVSSADVLTGCPLKFKKLPGVIMYHSPESVHLDVSYFTGLGFFFCRCFVWLLCTILRSLFT